jgi:hypothetical protein
MKKVLVSDLIKASYDEYKDELDLEALTISREGGVSEEVAMAFLLEGLEWPLNDDDAYIWWIENVRQDIDTDEFNFSITPSKAKYPLNMKEDPAEVNATLIYESIGDTGSDEAVFQVNVNWPPGSTSAPTERTYEMTYDVISRWSRNTSGTYFNANIRGKYAP